MAYNAANLSVGFQLIGGGLRFWVYKTADPIGDVDATDYFALAGHGLAGSPGMREGDPVLVQETDTDPPTWVLCYVSAIDADYNATVSAVAFAGAGSFTTLNATGATTLDGAVAIGNAAADVIGFHGATGTSQLAGTIQATSNVASSTDFAATQTAALHAVMECLRLNGLWKGSA